MPLNLWGIFFLFLKVLQIHFYVPSYLAHTPASFAVAFSQSLQSKVTPAVWRVGLEVIRHPRVLTHRQCCTLGWAAMETCLDLSSFYLWCSSVPIFCLSDFDPSNVMLPDTGLTLLLFELIYHFFVTMVIRYYSWLTLAGCINLSHFDYHIAANWFGGWQS